MYSLRSLVTHFSVKLNIPLSTSHYCFCFVIVPPVHITFSKSVYMTRSFPGRSNEITVHM